MSQFGVSSYLGKCKLTQNLHIAGENIVAGQGVFEGCPQLVFSLSHIDIHVNSLVCIDATRMQGQLSLAKLDTDSSNPQQPCDHRVFTP